MTDHDQTLATRTLVTSAMSFNNSTDPAKTKVIRHFLDLADTVGGLTDEIIYNAIRQLRHELEESPEGTPRFLLGVELVSILLTGEGEKGKPVSTWVEEVLKQYAKVLKETLSDNDHISVGNYSRFGPLSTEDYELALDIAQVIAVSTSRDSTGTINTLIRTIVGKAPEDVIKAKMEQLESLDFLEERKEDREKFYDVFVIEYLKRFYGMNKVMKLLQERKRLLSTVRIDTSGRRYCSMDEPKLWKILKDNCEITNPTQNQQLDRQFMTAELARRHLEDNVVKEWYEENFPELVRT